MDVDPSSKRGAGGDHERLPQLPDAKRRKVDGVLKGGRIGVTKTHAQVRCEQLRAHLQILHLQKAKKKEEMYSRPIVEGLRTDEQLREVSQVSQIYKRRDPDSLEGEALKTKLGSPWAWNLFLRVMKTGEETPKDVVDWASFFTDEVCNSPAVLDGFDFPVHFELTADETKTPFRRADEVIVDENIAAMLVDMFEMRHPKVRRSLHNEERWSAVLGEYFSDVGRGLSVIRNYLQRLDEAE